jgi:hypothetical protein
MKRPGSITNSTLTRKAPLRTKKPLRSRAPIRAKNPTRGHRFPKGVDEAYREWIRGRPCVLFGHPAGHQCLGAVECCHVKTRGAGGHDRGNCYPGCRGAHTLQHTLGIRSFEKLFGIDLAAIASELAARAPTPTPED